MSIPAARSSIPVRPSPSPENEGSAARPRRSDLDWLRVLAVLLLFPFHSARVFDTLETFYVKSDTSSAFLTGIVVALDPWHMPLLFFVSGASSYLALRFRSGGAYVRERISRLLVPLLFGLLVLVPPQTYLGYLRNGGDASFWSYLPNAFVVQGGDLSGYAGGFTPAHLWFILYLFVISLVALPILSSGRERILGRLLLAVTRLPGGVLLLPLPVALTLLLPAPGGKNPFYFLLLFLLGYLFTADERLGGALGRAKGVALAIGGTLLTWTLAAFWGVAPLPGGAIGALLEVATMWTVLVAVLGYGRVLLARRNPFLGYAGALAYAWYLVHQTVILAVAFWIVRLDLGPLAMFWITLPLSLALTVVVTELARKWPVTRFVLGMKSERAPIVQASPAEVQAG